MPMFVANPPDFATSPFQAGRITIFRVAYGIQSVRYSVIFFFLFFFLRFATSGVDAIVKMV